MLHILFFACFFLTIFGNNRTSVSKLGIEGLIAAVFTPFDEKYQLNTSVVKQQASFLNSTQVKWIFVAGTTGESVSLTVKEREELLEAWMNVAPVYDFNIIAMVGSDCLEDARTLALHAESVGVAAIAAMPPSFFKPASIEALVYTMKFIADSTPTLPFYYYHIPQMNSVSFNMYNFMLSAENMISNLVGIKYSGLYQSPSFVDVMQIINYKNGKYEVLTGVDEMMIECLVSGVVGFVGSQYNFAGTLYYDIINSYNNANIQQAQQLNLKAINLLQIQQNVSTTANGAKYMMDLIINVGDSRYPYLPIDQSDQYKIKMQTQQWCQANDNILSWCYDLQ